MSFLVGCVRLVSRTLHTTDHRPYRQKAEVFTNPGIFSNVPCHDTHWLCGYRTQLLSLGGYINTPLHLLSPHLLSPPGSAVSFVAASLSHEQESRKNTEIQITNTATWRLHRPMAYLPRPQRRLRSRCRPCFAACALSPSRPTRRACVCYASGLRWTLLRGLLQT